MMGLVIEKVLKKTGEPTVRRNPLRVLITENHVQVVIRQRANLTDNMVVEPGPPLRQCGEVLKQDIVQFVG